MLGQTDALVRGLMVTTRGVAAGQSSNRARRHHGHRKAARALAAAERLLIITGAGLSADSGLPTYRGLGGLYNGRRTTACRSRWRFRRRCSANRRCAGNTSPRSAAPACAPRSQRRPFRHCRVAAAEARHLAAHAEYRWLPSPGRQSARAPDRDSRRAGTAVLHGLRRG